MRDIRSAIKNGLYETDLDYPSKPKKPLLKKDHTSEDVQEYASLLIVYEDSMRIYNDEIKLYTKSQRECMNQFKKDIIEDCGLTDHPKAERAYSLARERSSSLEGTLSELEDLSELMI